MHAFLDDDNQAFVTFDCGQGPLDFMIGTALLNPHRLEIDYGSRTTQLIPATNW